MANHIVNCTCQLAELLRGFAPLPGDQYRHLVMVELQPGQPIDTHRHKHHTLVYYPEDASRPVTIQPKAGTLVYLPPGTDHNVPAGSTARVSVAMIIDD